MHFERGRDVPRAVRYRQQAAAQALGRYAYPEAIDHLTRGLALLDMLPDAPDHTPDRLAMLTRLGSALNVTQGYAAPEVGAVYGRARALCQQVEATPQLFPVLWGLAMFSQVRGEFQAACALAEQLMTLAPAHARRGAPPPGPPHARQCHLLVWRLGARA
jgi:hypothetical protein